MVKAASIPSATSSQPLQVLHHLRTNAAWGHCPTSCRIQAEVRNSPQHLHKPGQSGKSSHSLADAHSVSWSLCSITSPSHQGNLHRTDNKLHRHIAEGVTSQWGLGNTGIGEGGGALINHLLPHGDWFRQHERLKVSRMQEELEGKNLLLCMGTDRHTTKLIGTAKTRVSAVDIAHGART